MTLAEFRILQLADAQAVGHAVARLDLQQVLYGTPLVLLRTFGDVVHTEPVAAAALGEEHHRVVHRGHVDVLDEVAVARGTGFHADASPALGAELGQRGALDVAQMRNGDDHLVVGIEVLGVEFLSAGHDLGAALVAVLVLHLYELVLHHLAAEAVVGEDLVVVFNLLLQVVKLAVELLLLQTGELGQTHVHDGLRLHLVQSETLLQVFLSLLGRLAALDDLHHLLDVV